MARTMQKKTVAVAEEVQSTEKNTEEIKKPTKKVFDPSDGVLCRSVTQGVLFVDGLRTGMKYYFAEYDGEAEIEYRDLVALVRARDKSVYNPRFIIMDEDFINEYPTLKKFYDDHYNVTNLKGILDMPEYQMREEISKLPNGALKSLKSIAVQEIADGNIDSIKKIKALDEIFGTELSLLDELLN